MRDNHYELKDYTYIKNMSDHALSLLKDGKGSAFKYILHNLYDGIYHFDASFALKLYNNIKQFQIKYEDVDKEDIFPAVIKRFNEIMDEYFQNVLVDINEHHGL